MNEKTKVQVQGVPETMLQTLYARAQESKKPNHHIYDERAIEVVSRLDYDFSKAESDKAMSLGVIARTIVLDKLVGDFLSHYPHAVVLNIACGMDTRCYRMEGKYDRWYAGDDGSSESFLRGAGADLPDCKICYGRKLYG